MKKLISARFIFEGGLLPPWYYGYTYKLEDSATYVFYPIPINFLMRLKRWIEIKWNTIRTKENFEDKIRFEERLAMKEEMREIKDWYRKRIEELQIANMELSKQLSAEAVVKAIKETERRFDELNKNYRKDKKWKIENSS